MNTNHACISSAPALMAIRPSTCAQEAAEVAVACLAAHEEAKLFDAWSADIHYTDAINLACRAGALAFEEGSLMPVCLKAHVLLAHHFRAGYEEELADAVYAAEEAEEAEGA